jgi:hypothetical protein
MPALQDRAQDVHEDGKTSIDALHPGSPSSSNYHDLTIRVVALPLNNAGTGKRGVSILCYLLQIFEFAGLTGTTPITFHLSSNLAQLNSCPT